MFGANAGPTVLTDPHVSIEIMLQQLNIFIINRLGVVDAKLTLARISLVGFFNHHH